VLEARDQLGLRQNMALYGALHGRDIGFRFEARLVIQRVKLEEIVVGRANRRAWAAIANFAVIVFALARPVRKLGLRRDALGQRARRGRQIVNQPVDYGLLRCVRIVHDQREALRPRGRLGPSERGRDVRTVATIFRGNRAVRCEGRASQLNLYFRGLLRRRPRDSGMGVHRQISGCQGEQNRDTQRDPRVSTFLYAFPMISNCSLPIKVSDDATGSGGTRQERLRE